MRFVTCEIGMSIAFPDYQRSVSHLVQALHSTERKRPVDPYLIWISVRANMCLDDIWQISAKRSTGEPVFPC